MADAPSFLCDEMLAGLGRWLRIAGYDAAIAEAGRRDRDLVAQAYWEGRILLTRDRRLADIRLARDRTLVLEGNGIDACAKELTARLGLDWRLDPLSRCTLCNIRLQPADDPLLATLPASLRAFPRVNVCRSCGRLYWEGSHVGRIRRRLANFAGELDGRAD